MQVYYSLIFNLLSQFKDEIQSILIFSFFLVLIYFLIAKILSLAFKASTKLFHLERVVTITKTVKIILRFILLFIFFIFALQEFKLNVNTILTGAGALGAVLVLIFQNSLRDVFTGWLFVFEDVFRKNEEVIINNTFKGKVIDFTSRYLILETENGSKVFIPFSQISIIENLSRKSNGG